MHYVEFITKYYINFSLKLFVIFKLQISMTIIIGAMTLYGCSVKSYITLLALYDKVHHGSDTVTVVM